MREYGTLNAESSASGHHGSTVRMTHRRSALLALFFLLCTGSLLSACGSNANTNPIMAIGEAETAALSYVFDSALELKWTEIVKLPEGQTIRVERRESYKDKFGNQWVFRHETNSIPNPNGGAPFIWQSAFHPDDDTPQMVVAAALYFENGLPRIVTENTDSTTTDWVYGCSYTEGHRLWAWEPGKGWVYDWRARMHTRYIGVPNLYSALFANSIQQELKTAKGVLGPINWPDQRAAP